MDSEEFTSVTKSYPTPLVMQAERLLYHSGDWSLAKIDPQIEKYRQYALVALCEALETTRSHEYIVRHIAEAFAAFQQPASEYLPTNAVTLWGALCRGMARVADRMTAPPRF